MERNILNGKTVQRLEHISSKKVVVYYTDASHEEMSLDNFKLIIQKLRG